MISMVVMASLAVTPIRLEDVRQQSRQSVQALQAELDRQRAVQAVRSARAPLLPQVNVTATVGGAVSGPQRYYTTVPVIDASGAVTGFQLSPEDVPTSGRGIFDLNLGLSQLLYDAGRWALLAQAGAQEEATSGQAFEVQLTSELEGIRRFYQLYRTQRTHQVLEARVKDDLSQVERAQALFEAGKRRKEDAISSQVNLGNDRIQTILQVSQIEAAQADLAAWILRSATAELEAVEPLALASAPAQLPSLEDAVKTARDNRPLVRTLNAQVRAAEEGIAVARAGYLPRVSLSAGYERSGSTPSPFFTDLTKQNSVSASVNFNWNLFSGFATEAQVQDARLQREKARLQLEQSERELEGEVRKALSTLSSQIQAAEVADKNRALSREGLLLAEERFNAGAATTLEVRDAQLKVTNAELSFLESRIDVEIARAALERSMGILSRGVAK